MPNLSDYLQLGGAVVISLAALWAIIQIIKILRKKEDNNYNKQIFNELKLMNENHLNDLRKCIENSNKQLIDTIHNDNIKIIELLGRIDGKISK